MLLIVQFQISSCICISLFQFQEVNTELRKKTGDVIKIPGNPMNVNYSINHPFFPPLPPLNTNLKCFFFLRQCFSVVTLNQTHSHISLFIRLACLNKIKLFAVFKSTIHECVLFINTIFLIDI